MAKKKAKRKTATAADVARWKKATKAEEATREATILQAREMRDACKISRAILQQLRTEREKQGLSLADLNRLTGMSREAINRLENHEGPNPTMSTLVRIATALGCKIDFQLKQAG